MLVPDERVIENNELNMIGLDSLVVFSTVPFELELICI